MSDKQYRKVLPCGMLYANNREYFLLHPYPLEPDWEEGTADRFVAVPRYPPQGSDEGKYAPARHVVSTCWTVDYMTGMPEIEIEVLEQFDISAELPVPEPVSDEPSIEDEQWLYKQLRMEELENA